MRVVGTKKIRIRRVPNRAKYPKITVMLPTSSRKMAPTRKKFTKGIPELAMYFAVPSKFPIFPTPDWRKIKIKRILPIKLPKDFSHSIRSSPLLKESEGSRI
jgi:hypothetical protein